MRPEPSLTEADFVSDEEQERLCEAAGDVVAKPDEGPPLGSLDNPVRFDEVDEGHARDQGDDVALVAWPCDVSKLPELRTGGDHLRVGGRPYRAVSRFEGEVEGESISDCKARMVEKAELFSKGLGLLDGLHLAFRNLSAVHDGVKTFASGEVVMLVEDEVPQLSTPKRPTRKSRSQLAEALRLRLATNPDDVLVEAVVRLLEGS
ncbi:MAG: hypothetical protein R3B72_05905 [Polyangiaceae bacterium]